MFRSVLEGSKQAHLQHATPAAAQTGSSRRQTQQQQQQAAAPLQTQRLHAQQQLQLQQQQHHHPPPATSPAPAPAAASPTPTRTGPPPWLMQPPPWWAASPPTPRAAHDQGRQTQQPPPDPHRNAQFNSLQHQGGPALKAGMLPPGQQPAATATATRSGIGSDKRARHRDIHGDRDAATKNTTHSLAVSVNGYETKCRGSTTQTTTQRRRQQKQPAAP